MKRLRTVRFVHVALFRCMNFTVLVQRAVFSCNERFHRLYVLIQVFPVALLFLKLFLLTLFTSDSSLIAIRRIKSMGVSSSSIFLAHCPGDIPNHERGILSHSRNCKGKQLFNFVMYLLFHYFFKLKINYRNYTFVTCCNFLYTYLYTALFPIYLWSI